VIIKADSPVDTAICSTCGKGVYITLFPNLCVCKGTFFLMSKIFLIPT